MVISSVLCNVSGVEDPECPDEAIDARLDSTLVSWCLESKLATIFRPLPLLGVSGGVIDCADILPSVS